MAVRRSNSEAYVGWRLLGDDTQDVAFNVYRSADGSAPVKLNALPITQTTDFVDGAVDFAKSNAYSVRAVVGGIEQPHSTLYTLGVWPTIEQRISVALDVPHPFSRHQVYGR